MRKIIFRGKCTDSGEWVYGYLDATMYQDVVVIHTESGTYGIDPSTMGQFTGLYDRYGKAIYEGDVIKIHYFGKEKLFGVVMYYNCRFFINNDYPNVADVERPMSELLDKYELEIYGNVHDITVADVGNHKR